MKLENFKTYEIHLAKLDFSFDLNLHENQDWGFRFENFEHVSKKDLDCFKCEFAPNPKSSCSYESPLEEIQKFISELLICEINAYFKEYVDKKITLFSKPVIQIKGYVEDSKVKIVLNFDFYTLKKDN